VTKTGERIGKNIKHAPGDPSFGLQEERTLNKFRTCAAYRLSSEAISTVEKDLLNLETVPDLRPLMNALTYIVQEPRHAVSA
jgi:hypothetical protein